MTETGLERAPSDTWDGLLATLRQRYPGQRDSVLFCLFKLQQNPDLSLRDFRAEAQLYGIPMAGRALHSAKVLLGLIRKDTPPPPVVAPVAAPDGVRPLRRRNGAARADQNGESIENRVVAAVRQMQSAAGADAEKLRAAIRQAVAILRRALGD